MANRAKSPKVGKRPSRTKRPATGSAVPPAVKEPRRLGIDAEEPRKRRVVWRFAELDEDHPAGAANLNALQFRTLHKALGNYEQQTCQEIWGSTDNGCKRYAVEDAHDNIKARLTDLERDDETELHTLRLSGSFRVWGVLRENLFCLLWLDPAHEMWPSQKKHT